jgi:Bacterial Ig domain
MTYYKVYSTDTVAPTLHWPNPADGVTIGGGSYQIVVSSSDDHAVEKIELFIDNTYTAATTCDDIAYECQLAYNWSLRGVHGRHTVTFRSHDWIGNVGTLTTTVNVS